MIGSGPALPKYRAVSQEELSATTRRARRMRAALEAILNRHDPDEGPHTYCHDCGSPTPCPNRLIADEGLRSIE